MKKAIFFDLYGTLIDIKTDEDELWVYEKLSRYLLYHSVDMAPEELKKAYFEGIQQHLSQSKEIYPDVDVYKLFSDIMYKYGKKRYSKGIVIDIAMLFRSLTIRHFGVFAGLYDVLYSLSRNYEIAIISDAQWVFAEPEIAMLGLDQFFKLRILSSRFGFKKPDTRLFHHAMEEMNVTSKESVYIGDNPFKDLAGAKEAGMEFILFRSEWCEYNGFKPDRCFYNYSELEDIMRDMRF